MREGQSNPNNVPYTVLKSFDFSKIVHIEFKFPCNRSELWTPYTFIDNNFTVSLQSSMKKNTR